MSIIFSFLVFDFVFYSISTLLGLLQASCLFLLKFGLPLGFLLSLQVRLGLDIMQNVALVVLGGERLVVAQLYRQIGNG